MSSLLELSNTQTLTSGIPYISRFLLLSAIQGMPRVKKKLTDSDPLWDDDDAPITKLDGLKLDERRLDACCRERREFREAKRLLAYT